MYLSKNLETLLFVFHGKRLYLREEKSFWCSGQRRQEKLFLSFHMSVYVKRHEGQSNEEYGKKNFFVRRRKGEKSQIMSYFQMR